MEPALEVTGDRIFKANRSIKREREMTATEMTATDLNKEANAPRGRGFFPFLVLGIGIALSILLHFVIKDNVQGEAQLRFERQASDAQHVIEARIKSYADVLHGLAAFFSTSNSISRAEFRRYVAVLDFPNRYPGFQGLNYAEYVRHDAKAGFEARVRRDTSLDPRGFPNFAIKPAGDRPEYFVLNYLEPLAGNELAFGLDIASNPPVATALAAARANGKLTSSGRLLDVGGNRSVALAMRLPTYRIGMPVETAEERGAAYLGSVGAGFRVRELIQGALDKSKLQHLRFRLYDSGPAKGNSPSAGIREDRLLFDSDDLLDASLKASNAGDPDALFATSLPAEVGGRIWDVRFTAKKSAMVDRTDALLPWLTLAAGLVSSLLLFFALYSLASSRSRALEMAQVITKDLRESEASLGRAQRIAQLGNWSLDSETGEMTWSAEMNRTFGNAATSTAQRYEDFLRNIHPKDRRVLEQALQQAVTTGQDSDMEHRIVTRDGMTRWVHTIVHRSQEASK